MARDRRYQPYRAGGPVQLEVGRGAPALGRLDLLDLARFREPRLDDFTGHVPLARVVEVRHVLDEPHVHRALPRQLRERQRVVVHSLEHHHVDLDRLQAGLDGGVQAGQGLRQVADPGDVAIDLGVESVQADVDPREPGLLELGRVARQQQAVGGERDLELGLYAAQHADEVYRTLAHERLPAGYPDAPDARLRRGPREQLELLVGEYVLVREALHPFGRHAVYAAQVAPVGDRYPQVIYGGHSALLVFLLLFAHRLTLMQVLGSDPLTCVFSAFTSSLLSFPTRTGRIRPVPRPARDSAGPSRPK